MEGGLEKRFKEAVKAANETDIRLPSDIMLQFYAYYKQATFGNDYYRPEATPLQQVRSSFKLNAWTQLSHLTKEEAKLHYIKLVEKHITNKKS